MSWLKFTIEVVVIFVFIKFILFPFTGMLLGVPFPLVAIVSGSMEHHNTSEVQYENMSFKHGFDKGSIMLLKSSKNMSVGDVLVFKADNGNYIIHRIVNLSPLETRGDANPGQLDFEKNIRQGQIVGVAAWNAPFLGYPSTWLTKVVETTT